MKDLVELDNGTVIERYLISAVVAVLEDPNFSGDYRLYQAGYRSVVYFGGGSIYSKQTPQELRKLIYPNGGDE